jgi:hypothetical protein
MLKGTLIRFLTCQYIQSSLEHGQLVWGDSVISVLNYDFELDFLAFYSLIIVSIILVLLELRRKKHFLSKICLKCLKFTGYLKISNQQFITSF